MLMDMHNLIEVKPLINPLTGTDNTAFVSAIIDLQGKHGCEFIISTGTLADVDATFAVLFEHGDNSALSDAATVSSADFLLGAPANFTFAADGVTQNWGYRGNKRYLRVTVTPSANTGNAPISGVAILLNSKVGTTL